MTEPVVRKLVAGNWKMNGSQVALDEIALVASAARKLAVDVAICPPATLIHQAASRFPDFLIGAQDCHWQAQGAHTGCISVGMLKEAGARLVIVGHSERRADNHETDAEVRLKAESAISGGILAIVCVGETEAERDAGDAISVVTRQLDGSFPANATPDRLVIAYEPVWAIGTGRTPGVEDIAEMHDAIRQWLCGRMGGDGANVRILYGGSMKPSNASEILSVANVDGGLVGGASLKASDFISIIEAAA